MLEKPKKKRNEREWKILVNWLMQTWHTARELGPKRSFNMTKAFHFFHYEPGSDIITEGDRGLTFYIIVDGVVDIIKDGVGKVMLCLLLLLFQCVCLCVMFFVKCLF